MPILNPTTCNFLFNSRENTAPRSTTEANSYSPVVLLAGFVSCNALALLLKVVLVFVPLKGVLNKSSLWVRIVCVSIRSGRSIIILVSDVLKLPLSSSYLRIYSPSKKGTIASVELPLKAVIKSTEFWNVPEPSVKLLCLT